MKLYPIPGGGWAGTEADWKKAMKAAGLDPKQFEATKTREVPTGKKELIEFLTFFSVDVYRLPAGTTVAAPQVDVEALRAMHNPDAALVPAVAAAPADDSSTASVMLSHADNPTLDVEKLVETVCNAKGHLLKRLAGAVAVAFQRLAE